MTFSEHARITGNALKNWAIAQLQDSVAVAILVTRPWLRQLDGRRFRQFAVLVMLLAGLAALWQQRVWLLQATPSDCG